MKTVYFIMLAVCMGIFASCQKAAEFQDVIYITGTDESNTKMLTVDGLQGEIGISVRASSPAQTNIIVGLSANPGLVEKYNKENKKNYAVMPEGDYELSASEVIIKTGAYISDNPVKLSILTTERFEEGKTYLVPVSISSVEGGDMPVLETSRTVYIVVNKTIITTVASLSGSRYFTAPFEGVAALSSLSAVTYETRVYINKFASRSPFISSVMGIEENFLMRFGDVNIDPAQLQLAGGGYPVTSTEPLSTGRWYHLAIVFDGATIKMYIDGQLNASREAPRGGVGLASGGFFIGRSAGGRPLDGMISECRVWSKALSQFEIQNNICYVDPTTPGLIAYWRFNHTEGKVATDYSGNGYDATANNDVTWIPGIRCPE